MVFFQRGLVALMVVGMVFVGGAIISASTPLVLQEKNPRFGVWKLRSDALMPAINVMTYEPYGDGGMKITVESTNSRGRESKWSYVTLFDGIFRPVVGIDGAETAVEVVDRWTNRISNKRNGRVSQVIINVLSEDGNSINNEYRRIDEDGSERVSHAVYERIR